MKALTQAPPVSPWFLDGLRPFAHVSVTSQLGPFKIKYFLFSHLLTFQSWSLKKINFQFCSLILSENPPLSLRTQLQGNVIPRAGILGQSSWEEGYTHRQVGHEARVGVVLALSWTPAEGPQDTGILDQGFLHSFMIGPNILPYEFVFHLSDSVMFLVPFRLCFSFLQI
jgi:hypothetical protein